jgi:broad specificity phosphatase PhoE
MASEHVDLVLCSPLRRTMQTCDIVFRDHPSKPRIIVDPKLRQYFESTCDVGGRMRESMKEFSYFDFSLIQDPEAYYIHEIFDHDVRQRILKNL